MNSRLVVSYASGRYRRGQQRLLNSLARTGTRYLAVYEEKSGQGGRYTPHETIPYHFKPELLQDASLVAQTLLWFDASVFALRSIEPLFEHVEQHGYLIFHSGWTCQHWINDRALAAFGYSRAETAHMPLAMGAVFGMSTEHLAGRFLLEEYDRPNNAHLFAGRHSNQSGTESADPLCLGHRHDQSVLSLIAARHQYAVLLPPPGWIYYGSHDDYILNIDGSPNHEGA